MSVTRDAILDCLGTIPDRPDPAVETVSTTAADGYERRLVEYDVEPGERIRAYLLVPDDVDGNGERPGVLAVHPHAGEFAVGKSDPAGLSETAAYHYGVECCRRGHVVCCPDLLCFEDRRPAARERAAGTAPDGAEYEKFVAMDRLLRGSSLQATYLSDLAAALDVLESHDSVDPDSLGVLGHSLGGQEAAWLAWFDDRVAAAVASSGTARLAAVQRERITHNFALYVPELLSIGDMDDVLTGVAPTPLLVTHGTEDRIFPPDSVRELAATVSAAYADAGVPDRFEARFFDGGHEFPADVRSSAYAWLDRWLDR
ncbi:alpha/beta hydrolase family protein [Natrinema salifodinae]|uniref:Prolyl oligopeptidase family protein n=1 Tax=Natrinema salifodinae TaxID=1202768 RepID=A0A1I0NRV5_9EURY|nr:prolyl oligopeptidase family serine peptidase [Natrinema salifodinae]SEW04208.1 Prolyl oligopeptidase family protein [Natrinema salifodinae]